MLGYADALHDLYDSTRRCCSFLRRWVHSLILRDFMILIGTPFKNSFSDFFGERGNHYSTYMASIDPIEITSSDSETENDMEKESSMPMGSDSFAVPRMLPSWASPSSSNTKSYGAPSQKIPLPLRAPSAYERTNDHNQHSQVKLQMHIDSSDKGRTTDRHTASINHPKYSLENGNVGQPVNDLDVENLNGIIDSKNSALSDRNSGKLSSQQTLKRTLPSSLQPSVSNAMSKNSMENGDRSQNPDARSNSYHNVAANLTDFKVYMEDGFVRGNDDEVLMYEGRGSRLLPPTLMHGKSFTNLPYATSSDPAYRSNDPAYRSSDPAYRSGVGEERAAENDERLIFQAVVQDLAQPRIEATLPDGLLEVPLLRHQKIALAWMLQKETPSLHCLGGILADDQGLGKTISMIALIQMQRPLESKSTSDDLRNFKTEALNLDDDDDISDLEKVKQIGESHDLKSIPEVSTRAFYKGRPAAGTLVVCPASVLRQWARELDEKVADDAKLSVLIYHGSNRTKDPIELAKYDVVLTTYSLVTNEVPKQPIVDDDDGDQRNGEKYGLSSEFSTNKKRKKISDIGKKGKKGRKGLDGSSIDCDSGTLARVGWFRVVLDEAQTIKNHRTQVARACCGLRAKRRWCLSGTPIQNSIDDLYSYFRFLKYDPYAVYRSFCSSIKYPIARNAITGYKKLQAVLKTIMLRRTKGMLIDGEPIINLPPKSICLTKVDFSSEERSFYSKLEADSRSQFKAYAAAGTVNQNYANILLMLLRLRQACDHPSLVKVFYSDSVGKASLEMARRLPRDMLINLLNLLETSLEICGVCSDPPEDAVVTMCGHVFCYQCVSEYLTGDDNLCPAPECREQLGSDIVFSRTTLRSCIFDELDSNAPSCSGITEKSVILQNGYSSSKIRAALGILQSHCNLRNSSLKLSSEGCNGISLTPEVAYTQHCNSDTNAAPDTAVNSSSQTEGPVKTIIFSQWTGMLDLLEISLDQHSIHYRRLDGTMSLASRDKAVKDFNSDPEVTVILMSLKAGNLGLNMVAACHVILLDLWWNPTTEDQAIDRAHRIGQTRPVTVSRITIKDTVEDRILSLQEEKRKMVASAFGEDQMGGSATKLTVEDLRYLFMV